LSLKCSRPIQMDSIKNRLTFIPRSFDINKLTHMHKARLKRYHGSIDRGALSITTDTSTLELPTPERQNETLAETSQSTLTLEPSHLKHSLMANRQYSVPLCKSVVALRVDSPIHPRPCRS
jgi:hypothetical protein